MVEWSPDKTKKCEKCQHYDEMYHYASTMEEPEDWGGNGCSPDYNDLNEETKVILAIIIEHINYYREYGVNEEFPFDNNEEINNFNIILANICPLYTPKED